MEHSARRRGCCYLVTPFPFVPCRSPAPEHGPCNSTLSLFEPCSTRTNPQPPTKAYVVTKRAETRLLFGPLAATEEFFCGRTCCVRCSRPFVWPWRRPTYQLASEWLTPAHFEPEPAFAVSFLAGSLSHPVSCMLVHHLPLQLLTFLPYHVSQKSPRVTSANSTLAL